MQFSYLRELLRAGSEASSGGNPFLLPWPSFLSHLDAVDARMRRRNGANAIEPNSAGSVSAGVR